MKLMNWDVLKIGKLEVERTLVEVHTLTLWFEGKFSCKRKNVLRSILGEVSDIHVSYMNTFEYSEKCY